MTFDQMMAELREEYLASMPGKITDIESHIIARDCEKLRDDFHKLKGTGKTYGIPEISELGECMEKLCLKDFDKALECARQAIRILSQIKDCRSNGNQPFTLASDSEFPAILQALKS